MKFFIIFEKTGENVLYYWYNDTSDLIGLNYNGVIYYYIKNYQNDIIGLLDSNYNIVAKYEYDSFGNIINITDENNNDISNDTNHIANINPFRYRSYYYDKETKLYYLNSRYYNSDWCRFINMDSYGGELRGHILSHNTYALNNPIVNYDSDGNFAFAIGIPAIAKGILALATTLVAYNALKGLITTAVTSIAGALNNPYVGTKTKNKEKSKATTKSTTKTSTKVLPISQYAPQQSEAIKPCTTAKISKGDVVRGERLTIEETINHVKMNNDVMCDTRISAYSVASQFAGFYEDPAHHNGAKGYYPHFHPWNGPNHPHIWFYGI